ncbi:MAG: hypothetical protein KDA25_12705 [Phycisphaerales bacterium]|nr:hypothetical protein [Phycisphaerales bacterium]
MTQRSTLAFVSLLLVTAGASAQDDPAPPDLLEHATRDLEFRLVAGVWLPRAGGSTMLGAGAAPFDIDADAGIDSLEASPNVEFTIGRRERWALTFSGFDFSTDGTGPYTGPATSFGAATLTPGTTVRGSLDLASYGVDLAFAYWRPFATARANVTAERRFVTDLRISPVVGVRWIDVDLSLTDAGATTGSGAGEWLGLYAGLQADFQYRPEGAVPWLDMFEIEAGAGFGPALGGDGGSMWQVRAGVTWHVTPNVGAMLGYRLLELDVEDQDFTFDAGLQGLFLAASIRF